MAAVEHQKLPLIETVRLALRPIGFGDVSAIESLCGHDFDVVRWLTGFDWPYVSGTAAAFVEELIVSDPIANEAVFAVTYENAFVGVTAIEGPGELQDFPALPSLGYWLGRPYHGRGFASEAARATLNWAFEAHDAPRIGARVFQNNLASLKVLASLGFVEVGSEMRYSKVLKQEVDNRVLVLDRQHSHHYREVMNG
ncbi:MAG: GNAT family N-acetyltransferase [Stappiaceae bacterium]